MSSSADMKARHQAHLSELAELGMTLARDLHARAVAAETPAEAEKLAVAFHRLSRSVRQSIALEAKLERDRARDAAQGPVRPPTAAERIRREQRRSELYTVMEAIVFNETEDESESEHYLDADAILEDVCALMTEEEAKPGFADEPIWDQVARLCAIVGLKAPPPPERAAPEPADTT